MRLVAALALALAVVVALTLAGAWTALGAHPLWASRVGWVGAAIALILGSLLGQGARGGSRTLAAGLAVLLVAGWAVWSGKDRFAESHAEDAAAGLGWYIGWFGVTAGIGLVLTGAVLLAFGRWGRRG